MSSEDNGNNFENNKAEDTTRAAIDELIQENAKLKAAIEASQLSKHKWKNWWKVLRTSNWKSELKETKLRDRIDHLEKEIAVKLEESRKYHHDWEKYQARNIREAKEFWTHFQEQTEKYSHLFTNAHIEYSSDNLNHDIEEYRNQYKIVSDRIGSLENQMDDLKDKYGLAELGTNEQANLLKDIETAKKIICDDNSLLQATKSVEDNINILKLRIAQKKRNIEYLQNKSKRITKYK